MRWGRKKTGAAHLLLPPTMPPSSGGRPGRRGEGPRGCAGRRQRPRTAAARGSPGAGGAPTGGPSGARPPVPPAAHGPGGGAGRPAPEGGKRQPPAPGLPGGTPACRPHTQTVRSSFPEKMAPPSGEQSTALTYPAWPSSVFCSSPAAGGGAQAGGGGRRRNACGPGECAHPGAPWGRWRGGAHERSASPGGEALRRAAGARATPLRTALSWAGEP